MQKCKKSVLTTRRLRRWMGFRNWWRARRGEEFLQGRSFFNEIGDKRGRGKRKSAGKGQSRVVAKGWLLSDASAQSSPPYTHTDRTKSIRVRLSTCLQATHVCITFKRLENPLERIFQLDWIFSERSKGIVVLIVSL